MRANVTLLAAALLASALGQARTAKGATITQNPALVPGYHRANCANRDQCNDFVLNRTCFLDMETRQPSLTLTASPSTVFVGITINIFHPVYAITRGALCAIEEFMASEHNTQGLQIEPLFIWSGNTPEVLAKGILCLSLASPDVKIFVGPHDNVGIVPALSQAKVFNAAMFASMVSHVALLDTSDTTGYPLAARIGVNIHSAILPTLEFSALIGVRKFALVIVGDTGLQTSIMEASDSAEERFGLTRLHTELLPRGVTAESATRAMQRLIDSRVRAVVYVVDTDLMNSNFVVPAAAKELGMFDGNFQWFAYVSPRFFHEALNVTGVFYSQLTTYNNSPMFPSLAACLSSNANRSVMFDDLGVIRRPAIVPEAIIFDATLSALKFADELVDREIYHETITSATFRDVIKNISFTGPTGPVAFDQDFERTEVTLVIRQIENAANFEVDIGHVTGNKVFLDVEPGSLVFASGRSELPPDFEMDCTNAYEIMVSSECTPGRNVSKLQLPGDGERYCPAVASYEVGCDYPTFLAMPVALAATALGLLVTSVLLLIIVVRWRHPLIRSGQPTYLFLMAIGALMPQLTVLIEAMGPPTPTTCLLHKVLLGFGATLMIGALLIKLLRLREIFFRKHFQKINRSHNIKYHFIMVAMTILTAVTVTVSEVASPSQVGTETVFTEYGDPVENRVCVVENSWSSALIMAPIALVGIYSCAIANDVRHLPSALSEGQWVFVAVYNAAVFVTIAVVVNSVSKNALTRSNASAISAVFSCAGTLVLLVAQRVYKMFSLPASTDWRRIITADVMGMSAEGAASATTTHVKSRVHSSTKLST